MTELLIPNTNETWIYLPNNAITKVFVSVSPKNRKWWYDMFHYPEWRAKGPFRFRMLGKASHMIGREPQRIAQYPYRGYRDSEGNYVIEYAIGKRR